MTLKIGNTQSSNINQSAELENNSEKDKLQSNTAAENEAAIAFLANNNAAVKVANTDTDLNAKKMPADFLRKVLKQQPVAVNDENADKVQLTMKVGKLPQAATREDYNTAFRRAVYDKAMGGLKLSDEEIKLADKALIELGMYQSYYNLQGNLDELKASQQRSGNEMPVKVGRENLEKAKRAGQAVLQYQEYKAKQTDLAIEKGKNYSTEAMGGFLQPIVNAPVNIANGISEPFRAGEKAVLGTSYLPEIPKMTIAERSEYWNKDGRMIANKAGEMAATVTFGGVAGSKAIATQTGRALLGAEAGYNIGAGLAGKDITQTDAQGNARQMEWTERGLRVAGGILGARQTIKTEISTPSSITNKAVDKLDDIFKNNPTSKPQAEFVSPEGLRIKVNENTFDKPLQTADDLILEARKIINSEYAGKDFPLQEYCEKMVSKLKDENPIKAQIYEDVAKKYPNGVKFTSDGFPDFSPYAIKTVEIKGLTGEKSDFSLANKAAGYKETPKGYTWHHNQDLETIQLVPYDLHYVVKHTGGAAKLKNPDAW